MFECALFGMSKERLELAGVPFCRVEKIYEAGGKKAIVIVERGNAEWKVGFYDVPDRNKQRISITRKCSWYTLAGDYDRLLSAMGYTRMRTIALEGFRYDRNGYAIEMSKLRKASDVFDSSEEEELSEVTSEPLCLFEYYLVKAFVCTENVTEGEEVLNSAFSELADVVKLTKPILSIF